MEDSGFPIISGYPIWVTWVIYVFLFANILSVMIWAMDLKKYLAIMRKEFKVKHAFALFTMPGLILACIFLFFVYAIRSNLLKRIINFKLYPRPEWVPYLKVTGKIVLLIVMLCILT